MIQSSLNVIRKSLMFLLLTLTGFYATAQENININSEEVESWFEKYWMWVAGAVVFIILLSLLAGGRKKKAIGQRKTTTVIKDSEGNVKSVTTTEDNV